MNNWNEFILGQTQDRQTGRQGGREGTKFLIFNRKTSSAGNSPKFFICMFSVVTGNDFKPYNEL